MPPRLEDGRICSRGGAEGAEAYHAAVRQRYTRSSVEFASASRIKRAIPLRPLRLCANQFRPLPHRLR